MSRDQRRATANGSYNNGDCERPAHRRCRSRRADLQPLRPDDNQHHFFSLLRNPSTNAWSFYASLYTYLVPDSRDYVNPIFTADHNWLHLEARYNYEALKPARCGWATTSASGTPWCWM